MAEGGRDITQNVLPESVRGYSKGMSSSLQRMQSRSSHLRPRRGGSTSCINEGQSLLDVGDDGLESAGNPRTFNQRPPNKGGRNQTKGLRGHNHETRSGNMEVKNPKKELTMMGNKSLSSFGSRNHTSTGKRRSMPHVVRELSARDSRAGFSYRRLKTWSDIKDNEDLVLKISNSMDSMGKLLMSNSLPEEWYTLLVQIFTTAVSCQIHSIKVKKILHILSTSNFLTHLLSYFLESKQAEGTTWSGEEEFFKSILAIIQHILKYLPERAQHCKTTLRYLQGSISCISPMRSDNTLQDLITFTMATLTETQEALARRQTIKARYGPCSDSDSPPDDFREMSVIPTFTDLLKDAKPFVRAVVTTGAYRDQEHYLDIQFRLMREDFIRPLRNGINDYRENGHDKKFRNSDIRLYNDVHFTGMTCVNGINHVIQFDVSNMKQVKWDHSKRLINGNLLCLSNDNFSSNLIFATVSLRDTKLLRKGIVSIVCHSGLDIILKTSSSDEFLMAETTAYYEAVHPILKGLQTINSKLPFKEYIISCQRHLKPPKYLLKDVRKYNISCLMKDSITQEVRVLNPLTWPSTEKMCLNPRQRDAAILALTKEISLIQGPPGTGKTYVGLKVMQTLIENKDRMAANEQSDNDPILVICYTNHALDQFLEGILVFCSDGIVRVGGRTSSKLLEPFSLKNVKKKRRTMTMKWKTAIRGLRKSLEMCSKNIADFKKKLDSLTTDVLSEEVLFNFISRNHHESLDSQRRQTKKKSRIHQWLNAPSTSLFQALPRMIKHHMTKLVMNCICMPSMIKQNVVIDGRNTIIDRVYIYGFWLSEYQFYLKLDLQQAKRSDPVQENYLSSMYHKSCRPFILEDSEISHVIAPEYFQTIIESLGEKGKVFQDKNQIIECWLLGLHNECSKQLDDFERLSQFIQKNHNSEDNDNFDDAEESEKVIKERQFFEDEDYETKVFNATLRVTGEGSFLLNRAKLLGISENTDVSQEQVGEDTDDGGGFHTVTYRKPLSFTQIERFLSDERHHPMCKEEDEGEILDVWSLSLKERFALYKLWLNRYQEFLVSKMENLIATYNNIKEKLEETRMDEDISLLKEASVIGMTTTGAAKKKACLEAIGCRIIVVEEAAEVLEAHIVTALNKNCQHLILIGDHKQLRPSTTVYEHAKNFGLDVSLFERLVNNGVPHVTLSEQHRMRESISAVMRHIYPNLIDHISVKGYENIRGVTKNIFFIQHNQKEESVKDTMSKSNPFEAEYLIRLCKYFLLQGYETSQISVLATYAGQVLTLKKEMEKQNLPGGIRITPVDNFQGEENDIILLSLVRSNEQNNAGFLKVDNRVCVALSRAKKGMFAIGNLGLLASQSILWRKIKETAEVEGIIGDGLLVSCPNHPDTNDIMRVPEDFDRRPEGGCDKKCNFRHECGHICRLTCHGYDLEHKDIKCKAPCDKTCPEGHPCQQRCWEDCSPCAVRVEKKITECGHTNDFPCSAIPEETDCYSPCEIDLPCGHRCTGQCGICKSRDAHNLCEVPMTYKWPCDHEEEVPCHYTPAENPCPKRCGEVLDCGHVCTGKCSECLGGAVHQACTVKCRKVLFCGHPCQNYCGIPCPPCSLPCPSSCRHSSHNGRNNKHTCGESDKCEEPCFNQCSHRQCSRPCFMKCDVLPCERRCLGIIRQCGHPCSGLCGELCVCRKCHKFARIKMLKHEDTAEMKMQTRESSILLQIPSCRHIFILGEIDQYMKSMHAKRSTHYITCPKCSTPIQRCNRYEKMIKENAERREDAKSTKDSVVEKGGKRFET